MTPARTPRMSVPAVEPRVERWRSTTPEDLVGALLGGVPPRVGRPAVLAVDGRSGAGKSTVAARLAAALPRAAVVSTDDVAWHEPLFGWAGLLREGVLRPARDGRSVRFVPPAWASRGRAGAIEVPAGLDLLVVEGTGSGQAALSDLLDAVVWVQSDEHEAKARGLARDVASGVNGGEAAAEEFWAGWMAHEDPFFEADRPWSRADAILAGTRPAAGPADPLLVDAQRAGGGPRG